jgi:predicted butyrate kinase (DUF1464 family)
MVINHVFNRPNKITQGIVELISSIVSVSGYGVPVKAFWSEASAELVE